MRRQSILLMLVVLLLGTLFLRDQRLQRSEEIFLRWLIRNSAITAKPAPLTIVDLNGAANLQRENATMDPTERFLRAARGKNSPVELALFLQALLEFKPTVLAMEPILNWPENKKDEEQILVDQAMRVPKLLLASELTATPDPDAPVPEISGFPNVTGKRGDLPAFVGVAQQAEEDLRLISTAGFINRPREVADGIHVPLLFQYRGEVVPSFALQAAMLWMRVSPNEVKIDIGSAISFPNGIKIPLRQDGTTLINPNAAKGARYLGLNELLLVAEQKEKRLPEVIPLDNIRDQIVLARMTRNPFKAPDAMAASIAAIQTSSFIRRASWIFDYVMLLLMVAISGPLCRFSLIDLLLGAIAFSAAYCLVALGTLSRWNIWLPGFLPLGAVWIVVIFAVVFQKPNDATHNAAVAALPPVP